MLYRSEWTVGAGHWLLLVAFPGGVRQQLLEASDEPREKVAGLSEAGVIARGVRTRVRQRRRGTCSLLGWLRPSQSVVEHGGLRAVRLNCGWLLLGRTHTLCQGCWRSYGFLRPVLKHGPRSLTCVRVFG